MATMKSSVDLIASIRADMADNNAGLISAEDVRHNMEDIAFSINKIVASGDTETAFPFYNNVTIKRNEAAGTKGELYVESGVKFPEHPSLSNEIQTEPWLGAGRLQHNHLAGLTTDHPHTQYYHVDGVGQSDNVLQGHVPVGHANCINASVYKAVGFRFNPQYSDGLTHYIMTSVTLVFNDNSRIANSKGTAKAWLRFDASGDKGAAAANQRPVVGSYHNIHSLERISRGKLRITFTSGTFMNNHYVALGTSNSRTTSGSKEDFEINTVGLVSRSGTDDDREGLRSITFCILKGTDYVDGQVNDFVAYGYEPNETSGTPPIIIP